MRLPSLGYEPGNVMTATWTVVSVPVYVSTTDDPYTLEISGMNQVVACGIDTTRGPTTIPSSASAGRDTVTVPFAVGFTTISAIPLPHGATSLLAGGEVNVTCAPACGGFCSVYVAISYSPISRGPCLGYD